MTYQPSDKAVRRMTTYLRAHMGALMLDGNPHEALARWLLTDVIPFGMEIAETGDLETIQDREALREELSYANRRIENLRQQNHSLYREIADLAGDLCSTCGRREYRTWESPTQP